MGRRNAKIDIEASCFTVAEFCHGHRISPKTYQRLRAEGRGPTEIKVFLNGPRSKILISKEEAAAWRAARSAEAAKTT